MAKTTTRPNAVKSKSAGIKPYLEPAKTSFPNMMRRYTQAARDWDQKQAHSENIKPYLFDPDVPYPEIDDLFPTPFSLEFPGDSSEGWTDVNGPGPELWRFQCIIHCTHSTALDPCPKPVRCWYGAWTRLDDGGVKRWRFYAPNGTDLTDKLEISWESTAGLNGEIHVIPKKGHDWGDLVSEYGDGQYLRLKAVYQDKGQSQGEYYDPKSRKWITIEAGKSQCLTIVKVECLGCPADPVLTFDDDSTPDTITPGDTITIYVKDGLGPYEWQVSGTGYSLGSATTSGVSNTLISAAGSCGDGNDYSAYATVTVTDACGTEVTFIIRSTGGTWTEIENPSFGLAGTNCGGPVSPACYTTPNSYDIIDGEEKWTLEGMGASPNGNCRANPGSDDWDGSSSFPPPCGGPMACHPSAHDATCALPEGCTCYVDHYYYYTWQCP